eukprot:gb/GECH01010734.1/.p1 GENE.gb/GECH01010734.1/~~gb/GECH01010734.1/.p1  ORF type:complete len:471 (+),score=91.02 gb/GECH01010734.1/:1-1413(+)
MTSNNFLSNFLLRLFIFLQKPLYTFQAVIAHVFAYIRRWLNLELAPRPGDKSVSTKWLTHILKSNNMLHDNQQLQKVEVESLDGNRGFVGAMTRLVLTYQKDSNSNNNTNNIDNKKNNNNQDTAPKTLILKMSNDQFRARLGTILCGQYREGIFYQSSLAKDITCPSLLPPVIYSHGSWFMGEYSILMKDLSVHDSIGVNMVFGNQMWGMPKPLDPPRDPIAMLEAMFASTAEVHAQYWNDQNLLKHTWLKGVSWFHGKDRALWQYSIERGRKSWEATKKRVLSSQNEIEFSSKLIDIIDSSFEHTSWENLQNHLHDDSVPFTLCHGDFHAANMLLLNRTPPGKEKDGLVMVDWSEVGPWEPAADLAQTLISDVKPEIFTKNSLQLVQGYWNRLIELGVPKEEYPFHVCWESFCRSGVERWIWVLSDMGSYSGVPDPFIQYCHDQMLAFIESHKARPFYCLKRIWVPWFG